MLHLKKLMNTLNNNSRACSSLKAPLGLGLKSKATLKDNDWNYWFAGITDGDGSFYIDQKEKTGSSGPVSFEITTHVLDARTLYNIKDKLHGGSVKLRSGSQSVRYRVKKKDVIFDILQRVNGKLYHPARVIQFQNACALLNITYIQPPPLIPKNSAYLSGLSESDGSFAISVTNSSAADSQISGVEGRIVRLTNSKGFSQISFKVTSSHKDLVDRITDVYNYGVVYRENANKKSKSSNDKYHWTIKSYEDFHRLYEYFKKYPLKGVKMHRMRLALIYFKYKSLQYHLKPINSVEHKLWTKFAKSWFKYSY